MSSPGLPLGIYTNHWHRTVNQAQSGKLGKSKMFKIKKYLKKNEQKMRKLFIETEFDSHLVQQNLREPSQITFAFRVG